MCGSVTGSYFQYGGYGVPMGDYSGWCIAITSNKCRKHPTEGAAIYFKHIDALSQTVLYESASFVRSGCPSSGMGGH